MIELALIIYDFMNSANMYGLITGYMFSHVKDGKLRRLGLCFLLVESNSCYDM